jgi:hypothetical protein
MAISQIWSCLEIIVHRAISSSLDVIALFGIDQEQQDKLVQPCIAAIRYAEAACSSGTFELIHISSSRFAVNCFVDCCLFSWPRCHKENSLLSKIIGCRKYGLSE